MNAAPTNIAAPRKPRAARKSTSDKPHFRTLWISDVHLGTVGCKADHLVDFLKANECDTLYLVGDIIDGW